MLLLSSFVLEKQIESDARDFKVDDLGNVYLIHQTSIERINAVGSAKFRTSEMNFGNIDFLDLTNPLKPFVHYAELGKIVVLDNTLSIQGTPIDLWAIGYTQVELVAGSRGDAYWLWDARNSELIRVDAGFKQIGSTGNLSVLLSKKVAPVQLLERGNFVYLRDPSLGLLIFDVYGKYRTTLNLQTEMDIQVIDNDVVYFVKDELHILSRDWITEERLILPEKPVGRVQWLNKKCFIRTESGSIHVWALN